MAKAPLPLPGLPADLHRVPSRPALAAAGDGALSAAAAGAGRRRRRPRRGGALRADHALPGRARLSRERRRARSSQGGTAHASALARRGPPPPRPRVGDGRLRPRPPGGDRGARGALAAGGRALPALAPRTAAADDRGRLDRPLRGLPPRTRWNGSTTIRAEGSSARIALRGRGARHAPPSAPTRGQGGTRTPPGRPHGPARQLATGALPLPLSAAAGTGAAHRT